MANDKVVLKEFFLVCLPGLESLLVSELRVWFPEFEARVDHGGVTIFAPLEIGLSMNLALKIPTRILLRVAHFRCRDFPKLYKKVLGVNWREWIEPSCTMRVSASTRASRLKIKDRIESTCEDAWRVYQKNNGVKKASSVSLELYVRILKDDCTLSLDTSGERLHKRGERTLIGEAPLRETIAAALIELVSQTYEGQVGEVEVIDPMMGSGTFLLEAATRDELVESREFPFAAFNKVTIPSPELNVPRPIIESLIGFERDKKTIGAAKQNLKNQLQRKKVVINESDLMEAEPLPLASMKRWVLVNPPYGERLRIDLPLGEYYSKIFENVERVVHPDRACFLLPAKAVKGKFLLPREWKVLKKLPFLNGGIPVVAFVFGR